MSSVVSGSEGTALPDRFVVLDAWRGLAALTVAFFHCRTQWHLLDSQFIQNAWLCVDFFFVLSGFVLMHAYGTAIATVRDFGSFVIRRIGRLWPLHVFMLALCAAPWARSRIASLLTGSDFVPSGENDLYSIATNLLLVHSLDLHSTLTWNSPSWSISTEFYTNLLFGLVVLVCGRFIGAAALVLIIIGVAGVIFLAGGAMYTTVDYGIYRCIYGFFVGVLIYPLFQGTQARYAASNGIATVLELAVVGLAAVVFLADSSVFALWAPLAFGAVVWVFAAERGAISGILRHRAFVTLGLISYSIYMTHSWVYTWLSKGWTAIGRHWQLDALIPDAERIFRGNVWLMDGLAALYIASVIAVSLLTYRFVEQPWRRRFNRAARAVHSSAGLAHVESVPLVPATAATQRVGQRTGAPLSQGRTELGST
jgi:peptidoglycan/LPS O-acetylase OafA/YrhL